jgi:hypothetical protein
VFEGDRRRQIDLPKLKFFSLRIKYFQKTGNVRIFEK